MSVSYFGLRTSVLLGRNSELLSHILVHRDDPDQDDAVEGSSSARRGDRVNRRGVHHAAWRAAPACLSRLASNLKYSAWRVAMLETDRAQSVACLYSGRTSRMGSQRRCRYALDAAGRRWRPSAA